MKVKFNKIEVNVKYSFSTCKSVEMITGNVSKKRGRIFYTSKQLVRQKQSLT